MNANITVALIGVIAACFGSQGFWTWLANRNRNKSDMSKLMIGIGYSKIVDLCEKYIARGHITTREYHELEHYLYKPYRSMGGNGTVQTLFEQVSDLPIYPDKKGGKHD